MELDLSGNYTNTQNCPNGAVGVILTEGELVEAESRAGKTYQKLNLDIEVNQRKLTHSPSFAQQRLLAAAWGLETKMWIGKKFRIAYARVQGGKIKIELDPILEKKPEVQKI